MCGIHTENESQLPFYYQDNNVVLMARDPHCLFAYWDISEAKKNSFINDFGMELWEKSQPVLKITNVSKNYYFFIPVNDYASSWYINVDNSGCLYTAELGRRISSHSFISLATSNYAFTPFNKISDDTMALFANFNDIRSGRFNYQPLEIRDKMHAGNFCNICIGTSSLEVLHGNFEKLEEKEIGISSANFYDTARELNINSVTIPK